MKKELLTDGLPAPGEPLRPAIAEDNQALLDMDAEERIAILSALMDRREYRRVTRQWRQLARELKRGGYNALIQERWSVLERYEALRDEFSRVAGDRRQAVKAEGLRVAAHGRDLNRRIAELEPAAQVFRLLESRLAAHEAALKFERQEAEDRAAFYREKRVWEEQIKSVFRQSPRLHWMGKNRRGKDVMRIPKIDHTFIKGDSIFFRIRTSSQNPFEKLLGKYHSALPYGVDIDALSDEKTLKNLEAATGRKVFFEVGKRGVNVMYRINRLDATDGIPDRVLFGKVIEWFPDEDIHKTPWAAGVTADRIVEWFNFEDQPHILIAGSTQSGKSNHVNQMIATIVSMCTPDQVRLLLVDNKGGIEFTHWEGIRHAIKGMVKRAEDVLPTLRTVSGIMARRLEAFERMKAKNLLEFNGRVKPEDTLPRVIVIIDEMATLLGIKETEEIQSELRVISSQGRAVGIHLVVCTQHVSVDVLPGWIKTNMVMRISGKMPSDSASRVILDSGTAANLPAIPGRMVFSLGRIEVVAQSPYISSDEIAKAVAISREYPEPSDREFTSTAALHVREKFSQGDLLCIAIEELGGSLNGQRIHEIAGGNDVVTLRQLRTMIDTLKVADGISYNGVPYTVTKVRRGFYLQPVEQPPAEQSTEQETALSA